jgi:hypothetical protein
VRARSCFRPSSCARLWSTRHGFVKDYIDLVEEVLVRARRDGGYGIGWEDISDGRTSQIGPWTPVTPME